MQKQTVAERYEQQQMMKGKIKTQLKVGKGTGIMQDLQKKFKRVEEALMQAHQAVAQLKLSQPLDPQVQVVDERLKQAISELTTLKTATPELTSALPKATQQQINQLSHQIEQANHTLQFIKTALE